MTLVDPAGRPLAPPTLTEAQSLDLMAAELLTTLNTRGPAVPMMQPHHLFQLVAMVQLIGRHPGIVGTSHEETIAAQGNDSSNDV